MNDFERINQPRVEKILKMLETIETSARSNKTEAEVQNLLLPVYGKLGNQPIQQVNLVADQTSTVPVQRQTAPGSIPALVDSLNGDPAKLMDLIYSATVRLDEELARRGLKDAA